MVISVNNNAKKNVNVNSKLKKLILACILLRAVLNKFNKIAKSKYNFWENVAIKYWKSALTRWQYAKKSVIKYYNVSIYVKTSVEINVRLNAIHARSKRKNKKISYLDLSYFNKISN